MSLVLAEAAIAAYRRDCGGTDAEVLESILINEDTEDWAWIAETAGVDAPSESVIRATYGLISDRLYAGGHG